MFDIKKLFYLSRGQSLLEVIVAMAIFALIGAVMASFSVGGFTALEQGGEQVEAKYLAQEGIEAIRSIQDRAWNELIYNQSGVSATINKWTLAGEGSSETIGQYTRTITFENVCRDVNDNITTCPGLYIDRHSKKIQSIVSWAIRPGVTNQVKAATYLTNWDSKNWVQTDWLGGAGQAVWSNFAKYYSDDGNLDVAGAGEAKLKNSDDSCGKKSWDFDTAGDYAYDSVKIEVTGGTAQLKSVGSAVSGSTANSDFTVGSANWTYADWLQPSNSNVNGAYAAVGGNPGGLINLTLNSNRGNRTIAGLWRQSFVTTVDSPDTATLNLDWKSITFTSPTAPATYRLYAFIDTVAGNPVLGQAVWTSGEITGATAWTGTAVIDIANKIPIAGVYYLKIAAYVTTPSSNAAYSYVAGFDNIVVNWSKTTNGYASDEPAINPNVAYTVPTIDAWSSFTETATKNGGEIYYQLSDDNGVTWQYWNGSNWTIAGLSDYNTANIINANISAFATATGQITFRAFLSGDGSQQVILDQVQVSCEKQYNWTFANVPDYVYDSSEIAVIDGAASLVGQIAGEVCSGTATTCDFFGAEPACAAQAGCSWTTGSPGVTTNPDFDVALTPWTSGFWGTVSPTMSRSTSGGNPGGYAKIQFPSVKSQFSGGYFQQPFVVAGAVDNATLNLNWLVSQYTGAADSLHLYAFVDSVSGAPTIGGAGQVWDSGNRTGVSGWVGAGNIDVTGRIAGAGVYYLKIAAYVDYTNGGSNRSYAVGFDNALLNWSGKNACSGVATACDAFSDQLSCLAQDGCLWSGGVSYPTNNPSINPVMVYAGANINAWSAFVETATKNSGEIYYQLSDDDLTWQYWNGGSWVLAGFGNYNTANIINANISAFATTTGQIAFKAFLQSDGSQQVILDNVRVGWGENAGGGYSTYGELMSSAFNLIDASPVQILEWNEFLPDNTDIKLQLRTASDAGGSPGTWTNWYGETGSGSYFTNATGTLVSTDLNGNRWAQYRAELSGDGISTPTLQEVRVNYK